MSEYVLAHDYWSEPHLAKKSELFLRSSVRAIVIKDNRILLVTAKRHKPKFEFPGGGVDNGETEEQALVREVREETGLNIVSKPVKVLDYENYYYHTKDDTGWDSHLAYYTADVDGEIVVDDPDDDVAMVEWVDLPLEYNKMKDTDALVLAKLNSNYIIYS